MQKFDEINQELKQHISLLERAIEEHKRLVRKREKELEQMKDDFELHTLDFSSLSNKVLINFVYAFSFSMKYFFY